MCESENGKYFGYGGDFGENIHDGNYCLDGLVSAERIPYSGAREVKAVYQNIKATLGEDDLIHITNLYDFLSLAHIELVWELERDGEVISCGKLEDLPIAPHGSAAFDLDFSLPNFCRYGCHLNLSFRLKEDAAWAAADFEVAFTQIKLPVKREKEHFLYPDILPIVEISDEYYHIHADDFHYVFNRLYGGFDSIIKDGKERLKGRTRFGIWRPFGGADAAIKGKWTMQEDSSWNKSENYDKVSTRVYESDVRLEGNDVVILVKQSLCPISKMPLVHMSVEYRVKPDGEIVVSTDAHVREDATWLLRFGFELVLDGDKDHVSYYANGTEENYVDLCHHVKTGLYSTRVDDDYVQKAFPQEQGNHTGRFGCLFPIMIKTVFSFLWEMRVNLNSVPHIIPSRISIAPDIIVI